MLKTNKKYNFFSCLTVNILLLILCGSVVAQLKSVSINFSNETKYPVDIYWINNSEAKLYASLKSQTGYNQQTFETHKWSIRYQNTVISEYVATGADNQNISVLLDVREAGPIWNQSDAQNKCGRMQGNGILWTGGWWTTVEGRMSVCEFIRVSATLKSVTINFSNQTKYPVDIYWINDSEAKFYGNLKPRTAYNQQTYQTHKWSIRYQNRVIAEFVANGAANQYITILLEVKEAGPIWNQADAENKCRNLARGGSMWTGGWWTTVEGRMSVCELIRVRN